MGANPKVNPKTMTTITATITTNVDQSRFITFDKAQKCSPPPRSTQLPPNIAAQVLTPAQQREAEADAYIQRAIELHENDQLEEATYYFRLAAQGENPVGQLMYGLSLRHGWVSGGGGRGTILNPSHSDIRTNTLFYSKPVSLPSLLFLGPRIAIRNSYISSFFGIHFCPLYCRDAIRTQKRPSFICNVLQPTL
jgi:hypothetical protein